MPDDFTAVTAALTPEAPTTGDTLTVTITGDDVLTETTAGSLGPFVAHLVAPEDGATFDLTIDAVPYSNVTTTHLPVKMTGITDPAGRTWAVSEDGLTATAVA